MSTNGKKPKERILEAVFRLIESEDNIETLTTRRIAEEANVNLALINYYYQSKENLLSYATEIKMSGLISHVLTQSHSDRDASERLKELLTVTADFSFKYNEIFKIGVAKELKEGCKNSCSLVMPFLKEIFEGKNETELKIIALQLMTPFHQMVLYPDVYRIYLGTDLFNDKQRTLMIHQMVDSILPSNR